jgi:hypothetical protein
METNQIALQLSTKKAGQIYGVTVTRPGKVRKGVTDEIFKTSVMQGQLTEYAKRKPVRKAVEAGEREPVKLPSHIKESVSVDGVRFWLGYNGEYYLPVCQNGNKPKVTWTRNGEEVSFAEIESDLLASEKPRQVTKEEVEEKGQALFFAPNVKNVAAIH